MTPAAPTDVRGSDRRRRRQYRRRQRRRSVVLLGAVAVLVALLVGLLAYGWSNARRITGDDEALAAEQVLVLSAGGSGG